MSGFNLPPGVSLKDIDPVMVPCPDCNATGLIDWDDDDTQTHNKSKCSRCDGTGEVVKGTIRDE